VAIQAYRQLAARLEERAPDASAERRYPFHVGVTEAGDSEDGRIKSAIGIGALLEDGLGDTVRVSLTEDPVREVPVARKLARRAEERWEQDLSAPIVSAPVDYTPDPFAYQRRKTRPTNLAGLDLGGESAVRVELDLGVPPQEELHAWAARIAVSLSGVRDIECEGVAIDLSSAGALKDVAGLRSRLVAAGLEMPLAVKIPCGSDLPSDDPLLGAGISRLVVGVAAEESQENLRLMAALAARCEVPVEWCLQAESDELLEGVSRTLAASTETGLSQLLYSSDSPRAVHAARLLAIGLREEGFPETPIVLRIDLSSSGDHESSLIDAGIDLGAPLCDGLGDMVSVSGFDDPARALDLTYRVLQGARMRVTRTEFISCPSCGRTLFDLEEVTARIKQRTEHLKGVKIAIMGCIVNGPGEMADADFGYVGSGAGRVTLYVGKEIRVRNVQEEEAPDRLVELIQDCGHWVDPPPAG
jgi:(E)-4-hydroxy-3-methylbut-2-enyl-diphosphate synthase